MNGTIMKAGGMMTTGSDKEVGEMVRHRSRYAVAGDCMGAYNMGALHM
jgi:hypothetical protein